MLEFSWNVRNYEMSVWTLLDSYLTTLKSADGPYDPLESKRMTWPRTRYRGQVQNGEMVINMDGTRTLKFDIPMYIEEKGLKIENPNWYTVLDKNILTAMRKIKVIFDKMIDKGDEFSKTKDTFEFIILKVEETHEHDNCTCHVECEGLAFHELGKVGYTIALSKDDYNNDYYDWSRKKLSEFDGNTDEEREANRAALEPINNIDYWLGKAGIEKCPLKENSYDINLNEMNSTKWYYKVEMSLSGYAGAILLNPDKIYTEAAITDWDNNGNAVSYEGVKEMLRLVDIKESNLYNITQDLAETFGVFCRYDYYYDDNYGIDGKCIVFYNNYLKEDEGMVSFLYPDNALKISRSMDSTDITTKMFVRNVISDAVYKGLISIMDCGANKSKEDYLLNFDYLHKIKTISDELYAEIEPYELSMRECNKQIVPLLEGLSYLRDIKTLVEAKISVLKNSLTLDEERITETSALRNALDEADGDKDGFITIDYTNPDTFFLLKNSSGKKYDTYYVLLNLNGKYGIDIKDLHMYENYNLTSSVSSKTFAFTESLVRSSTNKVRLNIFELLEGTNSSIFHGNTILSITSGDTQITPTYIGTYTEVSSLKATIGYLYKYTGENYTYQITYKDNNETKVYGKYKTEAEANEAKTKAEGEGKSSVEKKTYNYFKNISTDTYVWVTTNDLILCTAENTWKVIKNTGDGIYLWVCTEINQINGSTHKVYEATYYPGKSAIRKHVNYVRYLYFATAGNSASNIVEKEIIEADEHDKWTSYLPTLHESDTLFRALEFHFSNGDKRYWSEGLNSFSNETKLGNITSIETGTGANKKTYLSKYRAEQADRGTQVLTNEVTGHIEYDKTGNPTKITNIYKVKKSGSYYSYTKVANSQVTTNVDLTNANNNGLTLPDTYDKDTLLNYANKVKSNITTKITSTYNKTIPLNSLDADTLYIMVKDEHYYVEGDKTYNNYSLKYYNIDYGTGIELETYPTNCVVSMTTMFKLVEGNTVPDLPTAESYSGWSSYPPTRKKLSLHVYICYLITDTKGNSYFTALTLDDSYKVRKTPVSTSDKVIPKYLYATYKYNPTLYYDSIKDSWVRKLALDLKNLEIYNSRKSTLDKLISTYETELNEYLTDKNDKIAKFNRMMGPALRESYWLPDEEYLDNGTYYTDTLTLPEFNDLTLPKKNSLDNSLRKQNYGYFNKEEGNYSSYGYDGVLDDDEVKNYYYYGIEKKKHYYPCIDISQLGKTSENKTFELVYKELMLDENAIPFSVVFNPSNEVMSDDDSDYDLRYCKYYTLGSEALLVLLYNTEENAVKPVIMLTGADELSDSELSNLRKTWWIGQVSVDDPVTSASESLTTIELDYDTKTYFKHVKTSNGVGPWISLDELKESSIVYPRIRIPSLKLKTGESDMIVTLKYTENNKEKEVTLKRYGDYRLLPKSYKLVNAHPGTMKVYRSIEELHNGKLNPATLSTAYTITIKPEILFKYGIDSTIKITYALSNADVDIYLDAKKILKENAYPKVSYDVDTIFWKSDFNNELYTRLAQIIMINDVDLKFENVFGYISEITIDLDHLNNDKVVVKNYKTKFEDLFSKIVALTEEMHKNAHNIGLAGGLQAGAGTGINVPISLEGFEKTIEDSSEILKNFIDEYLDSADVVRTNLLGMWNEAGAILGSAALSLNNVMGLTTENASILAGFRENVAAALTPTVFDGPEPPATFKAGDIWTNGDNFTAVAVSPYGFTRTYDGTIGEISNPSIKIYNDPNNDGENFGKIDILGATLINMKSGQSIYIAANDDVSIVGNNTVNIGGGTINLASVYRDNDNNDVDEDDDESNSGAGKGGIHLLASYIKWNPVTRIYNYDTGVTSLVDVTGEGITLASKNGIIIKSGAGIDIKSSDNENVSAVLIDKDKGIFIGSNNAVKIYTGTAAEYFYGPYHGAKFHKGDYWYKTSVVNGKTNLNENMEQVSLVENYYYINRSDNDANATYYIAEKDWTEIYDTLNNAKAATANLDGWILCEKPEINGASVDLGPNHLLLGVANVGASQATVINMTDEEIILAAGDKINKMTVIEGKVTDFSDSTIAGLLIKKDYIGMATGENIYDETTNEWTINRSLFSLIPGKVTLGLMRLIDENHEDLPESYEGSYIWLENNEIYVAGMGALTLNTGNIKLLSKLLSSPQLNPYSSDSISYVYVMLSANTVWSTNQKDINKIYLIPSNNKYEEHYYSTIEGIWKSKIINALPEDYDLVVTSLADSLDARKMGFVLGTNLQLDLNQNVGLAYWLDSSLTSHFLIQSSGAFFSITGDEFGIFKRHPNNNGGYDAATGLLWFDGTDLWLRGTLHVGGGVDGVKIYTTDDDGNGITRDWDTFWAQRNIEYFAQLLTNIDELLALAERFTAEALFGAYDVLHGVSEVYNTLKDFLEDTLQEPNRVFKGRTISLLVGTGKLANLNLITMDPLKGIFIGSGNRVLIGAAYDENKADSITHKCEGSIIDIHPERILFGVSLIDSDQSVEEMDLTLSGETTVGDITKDLILFASVAVAAGQTKLLTSIEDATIDGIDGVSGIQIKKDFVGIFARTNNNTSGLTIKPEEMIIGAAADSRNSGSTIYISKEKVLIGSLSHNQSTGEIEVDSLNGSYVAINNVLGNTPETTDIGISLGGSGYFEVNTENFRVNSHAKNDQYSMWVRKEGIGAVRIGASTTVLFEILKEDSSNASDVTDNFNSNSATYKRLLWVDTNKELHVNGDIIALTFVAYGNSNLFKADSSKLGFYKNDNNNTPILTIGNNGTINANDNLRLESGKKLTLQGASLELSTTDASSTVTGTISINSSNFTLQSVVYNETNTTTDIFALKDGNTKYLSYELKVDNNTKYYSLTLRADTILLGNMDLEDRLDSLGLAAASNIDGIDIRYLRTNSTTAPSVASADINNWTTTIPESSSGAITYYTKNKHNEEKTLTLDGTLTANTTLADPTASWHLYIVEGKSSGDDRSIEVTANGTTYTCKKGEYFVSTSSGWRKDYVIYLKQASTKKYIWKATFSKDDLGNYTCISGPTREKALEDFADASIQAVNIAMGNLLVPSVKSTGVFIGNGMVNIGAEASVTIAGNHSISLYSSSANNAVILDSTGITIGTEQNISLVSGASLTLGTVSSSSTSYILMNDSGITMKGRSIKVGTSDNHVYIKTTGTNAGVDIKGAHVYINGEKEWSRDDIIIRNPNATDTWRRTVEDIESHMGTRGDWVLIDPVYNATVICSSINGQLYSSIGNDINSNFNSINYSSLQFSSNGTTLGNGSDFYDYTVTVTIVVPNGTNGADITSGTAYITDSNESLLVKCPISGSIMHNTVTWTGYIRTGHRANETNSVYPNAINLCISGKPLKIKISVPTSLGSLQIRDVNILVDADASTSRVPCTVYYYPEI